MTASSRPARFLLALFGYSAVHWAAGRWRRALAWDALFVAFCLLVFHLPIWLILVLHLGQAIDAALLDPADDRAEPRYIVVALIALAALGIFATTLRATWVEAFKIPSGSMIPTLQVGDHMLVAKSAKHPRRGDVAVFRDPKRPELDFVKRVVAVGGDTIEIRDNQLILDGRPVPRVHVDGPCEYDDFIEDDGRWEKRRCDAWDETLDGRTYRVVFDHDGGTHSMRPVTVPADSYFFVGDNRDNSHDSRWIGAVPQASIKGVARKLWWSSGPDGVRWGRIDQPIR